jgi:integrase
MTDLNREIFARFAAWLERQGFGRGRRSSSRSSVRAIWRLAFQKGLAAESPDRSPDIQSPEPTPTPLRFEAIAFKDDSSGENSLGSYFDLRFWPDFLANNGKGSLTAFRRAMRRFGDFLGRGARLSDLTSRTLDRFEAWLKFSGFGVKGGCSSRSCVARIWRHAHGSGAVAEGLPRSRTKRATAKSFLSRRSGEHGDGSLVEFIRRYSVERGLVESSAKNLHDVVNCFGRSLGRRPGLLDLSTENVNQWIVEMQEAGLSPETIRSRRIALVGLWRQADEVGIVEHGPKRIRKVKCPQLIPTAWSIEEMQRLLIAASEVAGTFTVSGINRAAFWRALILIGYHSGLRRADLLKIKPSDIQPDGALIVVQSKTGNVIRRSLPSDVMQSIQAIAIPRRRRLFGDVLSAARVRKGFQIIVKRAGLTGSMKRLRATGATWCEVETPGSAMRFLGHRTPGLAYKHYVDPRFISSSPVGPPAISIAAWKGGDS